MCLASVAPAVTQSVVEGVALASGCIGVAVTPGSPLPVTLDVDEPMTVGADRIVNVLAAVELYHADMIVVDFGTATTFDCVTADARFLGGVIMPGLRTAADQLTRRTAKLPATELQGPRRASSAAAPRNAFRPACSTAPPTPWTASSAGSRAEWPAGDRPAWSRPAGSPRSWLPSPPPSSTPIPI